MKCPKCEEGTLKKIELRTEKTTCILCEFCNTFWEEGERVSRDTGKPFEDLTEGDAREFHITPIVDNEDESADFTKVR